MENCNCHCLICHCKKGCTECKQDNPISYYTGGKRICKECHTKEIEKYMNQEREFDEIDDHAPYCGYYRRYYGDANDGFVQKGCECGPGWFDHKRNCKCECDDN